MFNRRLKKEINALYEAIRAIERENAELHKQISEVRKRVSKLERGEVSEVSCDHL